MSKKKTKVDVASVVALVAFLVFGLAISIVSITAGTDNRSMAQQRR